MLVHESYLTDHIETSKYIEKSDIDLKTAGVFYCLKAGRKGIE